MTDGRLVRQDVRVPRTRCECGHVWSAAIEAHPDTGPTVVEAVVRDGYEAAARSLGVSENTLRSHVEQHLREITPRPPRSPDVLGIRTRRLGSTDWIVLTDDDEVEFLHVLTDLAELGGWMAELDRAPRLVVVEVDPSVRAVAAATFTASDLAVPPSVAIRIVGVAARRSFGAIADGRNSVPDAALCLLVDDGLTPSERDETSNLWSPSRKAFRRAVLAILNALSSRSVQSFDKGFDDATRILSSIAPGSGLARLVVDWRPAFRTGVREAGWIDVVQTDISNRLDRDAARIRSRSGIDVVRAVVVHSMGA